MSDVSQKRKQFAKSGLELILVLGVRLQHQTEPPYYLKYVLTGDLDARNSRSAYTTISMLIPPFDAEDSSYTHPYQDMLSTASIDTNCS